MHAGEILKTAAVLGLGLAGSFGFAGGLGLLLGLAMRVAGGRADA
jgi:hypothetical protein